MNKSSKKAKTRAWSLTMLLFFGGYRTTLQPFALFLFHILRPLHCGLEFFSTSHRIKPRPPRVGQKIFDLPHIIKRQVYNPKQFVFLPTWIKGIVPIFANLQIGKQRSSDVKPFLLQREYILAFFNCRIKRFPTLVCFSAAK